jgi:serine/threonine-protein kinase
MEHKIFLGKYRVAADEIALSAVDPAAAPATAVVAESITPRVYRGVDVDAGRDVAIEVIPASPFKPAVREQLEAEATAARKINHINIPALYDFGIEDEHLVYVTEYFDGTSAEEWVNSHGPMPTGAVLRIGLQVIGAMGAASFHKISHHAINPANLILVPGQTPEGDWPLIKVLHFVGVAPTFANADLAVASFDKTTHYASPEQLENGSVDFRSEIYSLGATMWFLLTGAPPLIAPKGPLALQPTTNGLAVDKLNGMPKRVRRLLAVMLAADPAARPQDPLALYRQIQDCVAQVERRESMARRFGVPFVSGPKVTALPSRRPFPRKALALAAILLALGIVTSVAVSQYFRHQRIRQAEEPIGVPIGVTDATASAAAVTANAPAVASTPAQTEPTAPVVAAQQEVKPLPTAPAESVPAQVTANNQPSNPPSEPAPAPVVAANTANTEPSAGPVEPAVSAPPAKSEPVEQPKVAANEEKVIHETTAPPPPARSETADAPKIARNDPEPAQESTTAAEPAESVREVRKEESRRKTELASVPTARPVAPEVRRAEPAPPAEGEEEVASAPAAEKKTVASTRTKKDRAAKTKRQPVDEEVARAEPVDETDQAEPSAAEASLPQLPRNRSRARFIGVTADGNWMFSLPSKKIVIVPPPPGG